MDAASSLIWSRAAPNDGGDISSSDVDIDDEALIRAYEKSRKLALSKLQNMELSDTAKRKPIKSALKNKNAEQPRSKATSSDDVRFVTSNSSSSLAGCKWKVGDHCIAVYAEDGVPYEAEIIQISKSSQTCTIRYCGYDEEDEKSFDEIAPLSQSVDSHQQQYMPTSANEQNAGKPSAASHSNNTHCSSCGCPPGPAPTLQPPQAFILPPPLSPSAMPLLQPSGSTSSTLHCALMSWYMAGFHTGYHQAVMDLRSANDCKRDTIPTTTPMSSTSPSTMPSSGCCGGATSQNNGQQNRNTTKKPSPV